MHIHLLLCFFLFLIYIFHNNFNYCSFPHTNKILITETLHVFTRPAGLKLHSLSHSFIKYFIQSKTYLSLLRKKQSSFALYLKNV